MKKPIVFDGEAAKELGVIPAIVYQKINEDCNTVDLLKSSLSFLTVPQIKEAVKFLIAKEKVYQNGTILSTSPLKDDDLVLSHSYPDDFEEVWKYYNYEKPNKGSKKKAFEKYKSSVFRKLPLFIQKSIIDKYRDSVSDVKFMKHFQTFLSQEIFEEWLPKVCKLTTKQGVVKGFLFDRDFYYLNSQGVYSKVSLGNRLEEYKKNKILECHE